MGLVSCKSSSCKPARCMLARHRSCAAFRSCEYADEGASAQSTKYFPDTPARAGAVAAQIVVSDTFISDEYENMSMAEVYWLAIMPCHSEHGLSFTKRERENSCGIVTHQRPVREF